VPEADAGLSRGAGNLSRAARRRWVIWVAAATNLTIAGVAVGGVTGVVAVPSLRGYAAVPSVTLRAASAGVHPGSSTDVAAAEQAAAIAKSARATASGPVDSAFFATGACVAYPPTSGDNGKIVFLDAGHGGIDPGGVGYTSSGAEVGEATVNLSIELLAAADLRARGYEVVVSRSGSTGVARLGPADVDGGLLTVAGVHADVADRDICANKAHADLLVGIYMDAGSGGAGSLTSYDPDRPFAAANQRFATLLQGDVLSALNADHLDIPNDGVDSDSGLGSAIGAAAEAYNHLMLLGPAEAGYFTTPSQMPGALIEPLYLTDPFEATVATSSNGQHLIATGIANAVEQYFAGS
jgi:N-acetylmuramoyl-L-alanine amidase